MLTPWFRHHHDDVIKWEHFPRYWPLCEEFTGPGEFPAQKPVTRSFDVFFDLCLNNGWVNNHEAGDLRRHRAHYDVSVMTSSAILIHIVYSTKGTSKVWPTLYYSALSLFATEHR